MQPLGFGGFSFSEDLSYLSPIEIMPEDAFVVETRLSHANGPLLAHSRSVAVPRSFEGEGL